MTVAKSRISKIRSLVIKRALPKRCSRQGLTLVEIMIALTMTLIVLGAMMSAFRYASEKMQVGRGVMEMANRLRSAEEVLRNDLANLTLEPRPYTESASPNGFLEIIEGTITDDTGNYLGDIDDAIGMTVRSADGRRFRGVFDGAVLESTVAEVWYFTTFNDLETGGTEPTSLVGVSLDVDIEDSVRIHRRALLIRPDLGTINQTGLTAAQVNTFIANNDVSVRVEPEEGGTFAIVANTLADLALRKNRFAHAIPTLTAHNFPNSPNAALTIARLKPNGEDIWLTDVAAFDVRVYSPNAEVRRVNGLLLQPGDAGYDAAAPGAEVGAFVDLGYKKNAAFSADENEWFANPPTPKSQLAAGVLGVFDTWSPSYESDGVDQDGGAGVDQGTNGVNDNGTAAPDDDAERETRPPYPNPIRGIEITTRIVEKTTLQVQQSSVVQSYVPE